MLEKVPVPDILDAIALLRDLRPEGPWNLTAIMPDGPVTSATFTDHQNAWRWIAKHVGHANLHYCANPSSSPSGGGGRVRKLDVEAIEFLHGDFDLDKLPADHKLSKLNLSARKNKLNKELRAAIEPSFIIDTGGGLQAVWHLNQPLEPTAENIAWAEGANRWLAMQFAGGEPQCANVDHLLRLPGTINFPNEQKRKRGRKIVKSRLQLQTLQKHDRSVFHSIAKPVSEKIDIEFGPPEEVTDLGALAHQYQLSAKLLDTIVHGHDPDHPHRHPSRSEWVFSVVNQLLHRRVPPEAILGVLLNSEWAISASVLEQGDKPGGRTAEQYAARQVRNAMEKQAGEQREALKLFDENPIDPGHLKGDEAAGAPSRDRPTKAEKKRLFRFTLWSGKDPKSIPPREFLYKPNYIRRFTTGTLAHGAVGKSIMLMTEAVAMTSGLPLLGTAPRGLFRVVYWNGEDPHDELDRRFEAIRKHYQVPANATGDRLFVDSGRTLPINVVTLDPKTRMAVPQDVDAIVEALRADYIDVLIIDPSVASHSVPENQNEMAEKVAQAWNDVAERANVAVHLSHHAVKARNREVEAMDFRGGGASLAKLRHLRVLNRMTEKEAKAAGIDPKVAWRHIRSDDGGKPNLVPQSEASWYQMISVDLENADVQRDGFEHAESDVIGVPVPWTYSAKSVASVWLSDDEINELYGLMGDKVWRKSSQSKEWVGALIGQVSGLDITFEDNRKSVDRMVKSFEQTGILAVCKPDKPDQNGNRREGYVVGEIPNPWVPEKLTP
jgi:hypothetical protein